MIQKLGSTNLHSDAEDKGISAILHSPTNKKLRVHLLPTLSSSRRRTPARYAVLLRMVFLSQEANF